MSDTFSDEELRAALLAYGKALACSLPTEEVLVREQRFSPRFERSMRRMIARQRHAYWPLINSLSKRVAMFLLMLTLSAGCLMTVEAIRVPVIHFFVEIYQTFSRISFEEEAGEANAPQTIEQVYLPSDLPEGFVLTDDFQVDAMISLRYTKGEDYFDWGQSTLGAAYYINTEGVSLDEFDHEGIHYFYYSNQGIQRFIWQTRGYSFTCSGTIDRERLWGILQSAEKIN